MGLGKFIRNYLTRKEPLPPTQDLATKKLDYPLGTAILVLEEDKISLTLLGNQHVDENGIYIETKKYLERYGGSLGWKTFETDMTISHDAEILTGERIFNYFEQQRWYDYSYVMKRLGYDVQEGHRQSMHKKQLADFAEQIDKIKKGN